MIEATFFIGFVVLIIALLIGILKFAQTHELNHEIGLDTEMIDWGEKKVWACSGRDHFNRNGLVWHYNGNVCGRWSKLR